MQHMPVIMPKGSDILYAMPFEESLFTTSNLLELGALLQLCIIVRILPYKLCLILGCLILHIFLNKHLLTVYKIDISP